MGLLIIFFPLNVTAENYNSTIPGKEDPAINGMERPVTGIYAVMTGWENALITYLSPLHYKGSRIGFSGQWSKALPFNPEHAIMRFKLDGQFSDLLNPAHTARMIGLTGDFSWGMEWRKRLPSQFQVSIGGAAEVMGGAYYLLRNGNNPVQAIVNLSLNITGSVSKYFWISKLPVLATEEMSIPSLGAFFCPEYGETYYEIYLGNRKGLAHPGWWGNNFRIDNQLSLTFDFGRTAATLGYRLQVFNQWANSLNIKNLSHSIVIGVIPGGIGLKKKRNAATDTNNYSIY